MRKNSARVGVRQVVTGVTLLGALLSMAGCQSNPSPLPPPPIASYGNEDGRWDADDVPPSFGGVGAPAIAQRRDPAPDVASPLPDAPRVGPTPGPGSAVATGGMADAGMLPEAPIDPTIGSGMRDAPVVTHEAMPTTPPVTYPSQPYPSQPSVVTTPTYPSRAFTWHTTLAAAQADARAQGKLILTMATRPGCGSCEHFKNTTTTETLTSLSAVAVGFAYDATDRNSIDARSVYRYVKGKLPGARLMPLVGFITPDVSWVHGFWGHRTQAQFLGDIDQVRGWVPAARQPVQPTQPYVPHQPSDTSPIAAVPPPPSDYGTTTPYDTTPYQPAPGDVGSGGMVDAPVIVTQPPGPATVPGDRLPPPPGGAMPVSPPTIPGRAPNPGVWMPESPDLPVSASISDDDASWLPADLEAEAGPWGTAALRNALSQMRGKRYGAAQATLKQIIERMPGTRVAREANKGTIAIYNAKRIDRASSATERTRYEQRAKRDLSASIWSVLF